MTKRAVQTSLIEGMERPIGPLPLSVQTGTNADLMWAIKDLYLTGSVLDVTYGEGKWWDRFKPDPFTAHDLYKLDGVDFRHLPEPDSSVDAVCFDPPYVPQGGVDHGGAALANFRNRFGIDEKSKRWQELRDDMLAGFDECARVARQYLLVKCSDFVTGGVFTLGSQWIFTRAAELGLTVRDVIVHNTGTGPGGHNIWEAKRCRRAHSYLLVFEVPT